MKADPQMSDTSQGPGWWQASDGKWYAGEQAPAQPAGSWSPDPSKQGMTKKRALIIGGAVGFVLLVLTAAAVGDDGADKEAAAGTTSTTKAPATTTTAAPVDPMAQLKTKLEKDLGKNNRNRPRIAKYEMLPDKELAITWAVDENMSIGLTKDTSRTEGLKIVKALKASGVDYNSVTVHGTYSLVDDFGNSEERNVINASYSKATLDRINTEGVDKKKIFDLADEQTILVAFQY
jgi:hypothetical protein